MWCGFPSHSPASLGQVFYVPSSAGFDVRVAALLDRTPTHLLLSTSESAGSHEEEATETEERMASPSKQQKLESLPQLPPLTCVRVVCRERPSILGIAHVVAALDAFLDWSPRYTVAKACALCSPRLLYRVLAHDVRESRSSVKRDPRFRQWQFERGMTSAVAWGSLELVKALGAHFRPCNVPSQVTADAASRGKVGILNWLYTHRQDVKPFCCDVGYALNGNHFEVAKWLRAKVSPSDRTKVSWTEIAVKKGRLDMVKWAYGQITGTPKVASVRVVAAAVDGGHLDILMWLFDNVCCDRSCFFVNLSTAVYRGHLNMIEWMLRNQRAVCGPLDSAAMAEAARNGRLDILRLLHAYKVDGGRTDVIASAARKGHLDMIKWLHANNVNGCTRSAMDSASAGGFLDVMQWLHENRSEGCSRDTMDWAAGDGRMEVLYWLDANRTEGCSSRAMDWAAGNGRLDIVKWLHINRTEGCTSYAMDQAAKNGHLEVVKWLHVNRAESCTVHALDWAAGNGHLEVVKWLHVNRTESCTVNAIDWAAMNGHLEVVKWLHINRTEDCTVNAMDDAAMSGHLEIVKWLHANRTEGCTVNAMNRAASCGHLEVVKWLHANRTEGCTSYAMRHAIRSGNMEVALFLHREREECDLVSAVRNDSWNRWEAVDWVYCHYPLGLASAMVANLDTELR